jgi:hypothetical protein
MYNFLPQEKFSSLYSVNELFSENFANIFCLSISLHLSFTNLNISFQLTLLLIPPHKCQSDIL